MAGRAPSQEERALWRRTMRDVARLKPEKHSTAPAETVARPEPPSPAARATARGAAPLPPLVAGEAAGIDRRTAEKLRRGRFGIEARLDLHGLTQAEAHRALARFLRRAEEAGSRAVLVITGKGSGGAETGILKRAVPRWLNEPALRRRVLAIAPAQPRDGGAGALYLLLKRAK